MRESTEVFTQFSVFSGAGTTESMEEARLNLRILKQVFPFASHPVFYITVWAESVPHKWNEYLIDPFVVSNSVCVSVEELRLARVGPKETLILHLSRLTSTVVERSIWHEQVRPVVDRLFEVRGLFSEVLP